MWLSTTIARSTVSPALQADLGIGFDAGGQDHDHVAVEQFGAVLEGEGRSTLSVLQHLRRSSSRCGLTAMDADAHRSSIVVARMRAAGGVELHRPSGACRDGSRATSQPWFIRPRAASSPSRPPPIVTAAFLLLLGASATMPVAVVDGAEGEHALPHECGRPPSVAALHRRDEGAAAGCDQQLVVSGRGCRWRRARCGSCAIDLGRRDEPACRVIPFSAYQGSVCS